MGRLLDRMSERSRAQLLEDVEDFGHLAEHGYRRVMELAGIGQKRARRLCEWMSAATPAAQRAPSAPLGAPCQCTWSSRTHIRTPTRTCAGCHGSAA